MAKRDVLIVYDPSKIRDVLGQVLIAAGYNCLFASDGNEALAVVRQSRPPLIVTQLTLPDRVPVFVMAGFELLEQARREDPDVAVIVGSGWADVRPVVESLKLGAYAFLMKPVNVDELLITVERALEHRELLIERRRRRNDQGGTRTP